MIGSETLGKYSSSRRMIYFRDNFDKYYTDSSKKTLKTHDLNKESIPKLLFFFDFKKRKFFYCDVENNDCVDWLSKDLPIQHEKDGSITLPHFKRNYAES